MGKFLKNRFYDTFVEPPFSLEMTSKIPSDADRSARGYKFEPGVDDAESECGLDSTPHDIIFDNSQNSSFSELEAKLVEFGVIH